MNLGDEVDLEDYVSRPDKISAAEVSNYAHAVYFHIDMLFQHQLLL